MTVVMGGCYTNFSEFAMIDISHISLLRHITTDATNNHLYSIEKNKYYQYFKLKLEDEQYSICSSVLVSQCNTGTILYDPFI